MKINILTLFPEMFSGFCSSIIGKAVEKGVIDINIVNIRDFSSDKHGKCDDYSFGGGEGMVMTPQPIFDAINFLDKNREMTRIYMSPKGKLLDNDTVRRFAGGGRELIILCGHYEGVDERVLELCIDEEISIGDYVLTGGELPAMVFADAVARFIPGVLGREESAYEETFSDGLLEYPQYTRPQEFQGVAVPEVLLSGHHENIRRWRTQKSQEITEKNRPDLLKRRNNGNET